ncbi:MAG: hypothetical protein FD126_3188, partial [Elusimicrobia bacterium]
ALSERKENEAGAFQDRWLVAQDSRMIPRRQVRETLQLYLQLAVERPDLVPKDFAPWLRRAFLPPLVFTNKNSQANAGVVWLMDWAARLAEAVDREGAGSLDWRAALDYYRQEFRPGSEERFASRVFSPDNGLLLLAGISAIPAAAIGGMLLIWSFGAAATWTLASVAAASLVLSGLLLTMSLTQARHTKAFVSAVERRLLDFFARKAVAGDPSEVLDALGEFDSERERWFAKPGFQKPFDRLILEWPAFKQAARAP